MECTDEEMKYIDDQLDKVKMNIMKNILKNRKTPIIKIDDITKQYITEIYDIITYEEYINTDKLNKKYKRINRTDVYDNFVKYLIDNNSLVKPSKKVFYGMLHEMKDLRLVKSKGNRCFLIVLKKK
jgi:hypothetical protein